MNDTTDPLGAWLESGFRSRERAGLRSPPMEPSPGGGRRSSETPAHLDVGQFGTDLVAAGVTRDEDACLWGRWMLEGRWGSQRSQATSVDVADFLSARGEYEGNREARDAYPGLPMFTTGAVKQMVKQAERRLKLTRPWRRKRNRCKE